MLKSVLLCVIVILAGWFTHAQDVSSATAIAPDPIIPVSSSGESVDAAMQERDGVGYPHPPPPSCYNIYRQSLDGLCNNLKYPYWGAVKSPFRHPYCVPEFPDPKGDEMAGKYRPNPRVLSNLIHGQPYSVKTEDERGLAELAVHFGQFINHETNDAEEGQGLPGPEYKTGEFKPYDVPPNDVFFQGQPVVPFARADYKPGYPRKHVNARVSAYVDGSTVYSPSAEVLKALREYQGGRLKVVEYPYGVFPANQSREMNYMAAPPGILSTSLPLVGDFRGDEQPGLLMMHTLFVREHNFWCKLIAKHYPVFKDEEIFQLARAIVRAILQHIFFYEYLPAVIGEHNFHKYISLYSGYKDTCDATPSLEYVSACFRFGHSQLKRDYMPLDKEFKPCCGGEVPAPSVFFNPSYLIGYGVEPLLRSFMCRKAEQVDRQCTDTIRNIGIDVVTDDIGRGRDYGLPSYTKCRAKWVPEEPMAASFYDLKTVDGDDVYRLGSAYKSVHDMDFFTGVLSEKHAYNSSLSEVCMRVLVDTITKFRDCDRFWFEREGVFMPNDLSIDNKFREIVKQYGHFRDVLLRNTRLKASEVAEKPFFASHACHCPKKLRENCYHPDLPLSATTASTSGYQPLYKNPYSSSESGEQLVDTLYDAVEAVLGEKIKLLGLAPDVVGALFDSVVASPIKDVMDKLDLKLPDIKISIPIFPTVATETNAALYTSPKPIPKK